MEVSEKIRRMLQGNTLAPISTIDDQHDKLESALIAFVENNTVATKHILGISANCIFNVII